MSAPKVQLYIRVSLPDGTNPYLKPAYSLNRRIKSQVAVVNRRRERHPEGIYYLRYQVDGKRKWECVGSDAQLAVTAKQQRTHAFESVALGLTTPASIQPVEEPTPISNEDRKRLTVEIASYP